MKSFLDDIQKLPSFRLSTAETLKTGSMTIKMHLSKTGKGNANTASKKLNKDEIGGFLILFLEHPIGEDKQFYGPNKIEKKYFKYEMTQGAEPTYKLEPAWAQEMDAWMAVVEQERKDVVEILVFAVGAR